MTSIYLTVTAMNPEERHELERLIVLGLEGKVRCVGGGTSFGEDPESDLDFETDLVKPEEVTTLAALMWQMVGPATGCTIKVIRVAVVPSKEN